MQVTDLELDLEVFSGPFDLLLTLVLREEIDLLEVDLAEIVVCYIDHLSRQGQLDLDATTEFVLLVAALLELKSRLLLPEEETDEELEELTADEAFEELLERMLKHKRFQAAGQWLQDTQVRNRPYRYRSVPLPEDIRTIQVEEAEVSYSPDRLGKAIGQLLTKPQQVDVSHLHAPRVTVAERVSKLRSLLGKGSFNFERAVEKADRVTQAVTVFALLELYKQGEAIWHQSAPFAEITVEAAKRQLANGQQSAEGGRQIANRQQEAVEV